ncbi:hypothetical protein LINPERHAP1_LOCUS30133 [Linum perenne]
MLVPGPPRDPGPPPPPGWIKINVDASTRPDSAGGVVGFVARNAEGHVLESRARVFQGQTNVTSLELLGFREAVSWARTNNLACVIFEGDSLEVVSQLRNQNPLHSSCGAIFDEVLSSCSAFSHYSFQYVPRLCNRAADFVAKKALSLYPLYGSVDYWLVLLNLLS